MSKLKIVMCTTCRGRVEHVALTLPANLRDNASATFVLLDYNDLDGLAAYVRREHARDIESGRLVYYHAPGHERFHMAHAKNTGHRCGLLEGADVLVTLDADNLTGPGFDEHVRAKLLADPGSFLAPKVVALGGGSVRIAPRGVAGRLALRARDWVKAGGYDEKYDTWRGEDVDLVARLKRMGLAPRFIDPAHLDAVRHGPGLRFKEYPHAQAFENDEEAKRVSTERHTVVNFGQIGVGTVHRNFSEEPIALRPLPTRVFGIGFQRTGTTSLNQAFKLLGLDAFHWDTGYRARDIWEQVAEFGSSRTLERYDALSDNPIPLLYRELDAAYPGSKFVLTVRDEAAWLASVERLWDPLYNPNRWEWDVWPISNRIHRALYGRTDFHAETFLARYRKHNAEVLEHFRSRPGDLLVMNVVGGDGWGQLAPFLGARAPDAPFPHGNPSFKPKKGSP